MGCLGPPAINSAGLSWYRRLCLILMLLRLRSADLTAQGTPVPHRWLQNTLVAVSTQSCASLCSSKRRCGRQSSGQPNASKFSFGFTLDTGHSHAMAWLQRCNFPLPFHVLCLLSILFTLPCVVARKQTKVEYKQMFTSMKHGLD